MALKMNYSASAFRICVDQIDGSIISGRIVSQRLKIPVSFSDVNSLVSLADHIMDLQKFPQAFQRIRTFPGVTSSFQQDLPVATTAEEMMPSDAVSSLFGRTTTFLLQVTMRQASSWQGFIDWLDESPKQPFSSTLEFLTLLDAKAHLYNDLPPVP